MNHLSNIFEERVLQRLTVILDVGYFCVSIISTSNLTSWFEEERMP